MSASVGSGEKYVTRWIGSTRRCRQRAAGSISDHLQWLADASGATTHLCYAPRWPDPTSTPGLLSRTSDRPDHNAADRPRTEQRLRRQAERGRHRSTADTA